MMKNKHKIKRSVSRRFKVTKTGKVMFSHQNSGHLKTNKSNRAIRRGKVEGNLSKPFAKKVKQMLNVA